MLKGGYPKPSASFMVFFGHSKVLAFPQRGPYTGDINSLTIYN